MITTAPLKIKICCISSIEEAGLAISAGASALGLVSEMPSGPGPIKESLIAEIASAVPPGISTFLLTSLQNTEEIIAQQKRCLTNTIQICDELVSGSYADLKKELPGIVIVQVIHVTGMESVEKAEAVSKDVHAILLDSGNQTAEIKELGGTGRTHNWEVSKKIVETVNIPVFLAGGLNPDNIAEAVKKVRPYGIDICSGVRINGKLDKQKLYRFTSEAQKAIQK